MTNQYLEEKVFELEKRVEKIELSKIISDLPSINEPCDAISRDAVQKAINCWIGSGEYRYAMSERFLIDRINDLPSVTQKSDEQLYKNGFADGYEQGHKDAEQKSGKCKDCKWWKDSDGVYRRGVGAESKCPINNVSVNHGFGYCYMFEPQESEE